MINKECTKHRKASLYWSLDIHCPFCDKLIDLQDHDDDGVFSTPIFNNRWDDINDMAFECPHCEKYFIIDGVEY